MLKDIRYLTHHYKGISDNILILDGIGDFFVLETFMSNELRRNLNTVYYASRTQKFIVSAWSCLPNFPNLKNHIFLWDDWNSVFCYFRKSDLIKRKKIIFRNKDIDFSKIREYVWADLFSNYKRKMCTESSF